MTDTVLSTSLEDHTSHVKPQWVGLPELLQTNAQYTRCQGAELTTSDGRVILDYLSGYCVHNAGHEIARGGPVMLQSHVPDPAGDLAKRLCNLAGGKFTKAFFACSGSEGIESTIKFARAATGKNGLLYANGAFHGLTCGALSLMGDDFWRDKFGPVRPDTVAIPFNDLAALAGQLATKQFAAFFVEPIQSEAGIRLPDAGYLREAQALCSRYGALLVLDEVQTGMYRTGRFLAAHHYSVEPDIVIIAKALSGGLVPCSAVLMSNRVYEATCDSLKRSLVHTSTFNENSMSMRAGLATLDILAEKNVGERAFVMGEVLRERLRDALAGYEMVREVRGMGMLSGIEFQAPKHLRLRAPFEAFRHIYSGMFGQIVVMRLYNDHRILTQVCGNNFMVLKVAPPLVVTEEQVDRFVAAARSVVDLMHNWSSFWTDAMGFARRAMSV